MLRFPKAVSHRIMLESLRRDRRKERHREKETEIWTETWGEMRKR